MIRMTGLVDLKPLREMETRIPQTTEDVTGGVENMEQDQPPKESEGPVDDHEGSMAKADLLSIHKKSGELYNMIAEDEELEGWVQAKITKAAEYITAVHNNMEYEKTKPTTIGNGEMAPADPMNERTIARLQALAGIAPLTENVLEGKWYNSNEEEPTHLGQVGSSDYIRAGYDAGDEYPEFSPDQLGEPRFPDADADGSEDDIPFEESHTIEEWMGIMAEAGVNLNELSPEEIEAQKNSPEAIAKAAERGSNFGFGPNDRPSQVGYKLRRHAHRSRMAKRPFDSPEILSQDGINPQKYLKHQLQLKKSRRDSVRSAGYTVPQLPLPEQYTLNIVSRLQQLAGLAPLYENVTPSAVTETVEEATLSEKAPTGWEATVKKMKRNMNKKKEIDNPWALAHWMASRGYHPKGKKSKE